MAECGFVLLIQLRAVPSTFAAERLVRLAQSFVLPTHNAIRRGNRWEGYRLFSAMIRGRCCVNQERQSGHRSALAQ